MDNSHTLLTYRDLDFWFQVSQVRPVLPEVQRAQLLASNGTVKMKLQRDAVVSWKRLAVISPRPDRAPIGIPQNSGNFCMVSTSKGEYFFVCFN